MAGAGSRTRKDGSPSAKAGSVEVLRPRMLGPGMPTMKEVRELGRVADAAGNGKRGAELSAKAASARAARSTFMAARRQERERAQGAAAAPARQTATKPLATDPALYQVRRRFGVAGGPDEVVLSPHGAAVSFARGAGLPPSGPEARALAALAKAGGEARTETREGSRVTLTDFGHDHSARALTELGQYGKGYIERDGAAVRLTERGKQAVEQGHAEQGRLLARAKASHDHEVAQKPPPAVAKPAAHQTDEQRWAADRERWRREEREANDKILRGWEEQRLAREREKARSIAEHNAKMGNTIKIATGSGPIEIPALHRAGDFALHGEHAGGGKVLKSKLVVTHTPTGQTMRELTGEIRSETVGRRLATAFAHPEVTGALNAHMAKRTEETSAAFKAAWEKHKPGAAPATKAPREAGKVPAKLAPDIGHRDAVTLNAMETTMAEGRVLHIRADRLPGKRGADGHEAKPAADFTVGPNGRGGHVLVDYSRVKSGEEHEYPTAAEATRAARKLLGWERLGAARAALVAIHGEPEHQRGNLERDAAQVARGTALARAYGHKPGIRGPLFGPSGQGRG